MNSTLRRLSAPVASAVDSVRLPAVCTVAAPAVAQTSYPYPYPQQQPVPQPAPGQPGYGYYAPQQGYGQQGYAYNQQFRGAAPVFIDVGSFEAYGGGPWAGYRQFCQTILFPLLRPE